MISLQEPAEIWWCHHSVRDYSISSRSTAAILDAHNRGIVITMTITCIAGPIADGTHTRHN